MKVTLQDGRIAELIAACNRELLAKRRYSTLQKRISYWAELVWPGTTPGKKYLKLLEEVEELGMEIRRNNKELAKGELADCAIVLMHLAEMCGHDLFAAIDEKMTRNVQKHGGIFEEA